ncbi:MAG: hypothetical protein R3B84_09745 [Zavarzinella sp.]
MVVNTPARVGGGIAGDRGTIDRDRAARPEVEQAAAVGCIVRGNCCPVNQINRAAGCVVNTATYEGGCIAGDRGAINRDRAARPEVVQAAAAACGVRGYFCPVDQINRAAGCVVNTPTKVGGGIAGDRGTINRDNAAGSVVNTPANVGGGIAGDRGAVC